MQLEILSNLRNLQTEIIKQLNTMSIAYDVKNDLRYLQGKEEGKVEETKTIILILRLLKKGNLSIKEIAEKAKVPVEKVLELKNEID